MRRGFDMFMWAGIAFVAIVMVFMASSYDIKMKSGLIDTEKLNGCLKDINNILS